MTPSRQRSLIVFLVILGVLTAGFFGLRALFALREFRRHGPPPLADAMTELIVETDVELIRDWMTIPYIARTYQVNPRVFFDALNISPRENGEKSLLQLNEEFFPDQPGIVVELVKAIVQANQPPAIAVTPNAPAVPPTAP